MRLLTPTNDTNGASAQLCKASGYRSGTHSGSVDLSPVLRAMVVAAEEGMGALRFSLGRGTTEAEIREVAERLDRALVAGVGASVGGG
jgi:cysteine sulfinate desulfinase/cysteine desulfurase-like protein